MNWGSLSFATLTVVLALVSGCRTTSYETFRPAMPIAPPAFTYQDEGPAQSLSGPRPSCGAGCRSCPGGSAPVWSEPGLLTPAAG